MVKSFWFNKWIFYGAKATEIKKTYIKMTTKALLAKILGISMFGYLVGIA
jgi:hypothetical protein